MGTLTHSSLLGRKELAFAELAVCSPLLLWGGVWSCRAVESSTENEWASRDLGTKDGGGGMALPER